MRLLAVLLAMAASAQGQVATGANSAYKTPESRAVVAGHLEGAERDAKQRPAELVSALGVKPGMTVADIGTGVGYMLPHLSKAVGPKGQVYGEDIFPDFLARAGEKVEQSHLTNVSLVMGSDRDPKLQPGCCDLVLVLDVYHHFDFPEAVLAVLRNALREKGRLAIVEYYKNSESMPNGAALTHIRLTEDDLVKEVEANGFKLVSKRPFTERVQYIALFEAKPLPSSAER